MTICRSLVLVLLSASFLAACNPSTTNNHNTYQAGPSGMSGGGATKDPGGSTGTADGGGGGQGVLCSQTNDPKISHRLFVRDIYEAIYNHNRKIKNISDDTQSKEDVYPEAILALTNSLKKVFGPSSRNLEFIDQNFWIQFTKKISFIDDDKKLYPSQDANSPIALPDGCKIVQIAYWDEAAGGSEDGTLYINRTLWTKLDQINKIGLLAHEYFFKLARKAKYKNSDMTRFRVGQLLSEEGLEPLFKNWAPSSISQVRDSLPESPTGFKYCVGSSEEDSTAKLHFYQYEGSDKLQHLSIPLLQSNTINAEPFQISDFAFRAKDNLDLGKATDLLLYQTHASGYGRNPVIGLTTQSWSNIWFNSTDLITVPWYQDINPEFSSILKEMSQKKEALWTVYFTQPTNPIKVELINPFFINKLQYQKKIKSRDDLILAIHSKIESTIGSCVGTETPNPDAKGALAVLNKEIFDSQSKGEHPGDYPKWNAVIFKIKLKYGSQNTACVDLSDEKYQITLPNLLYKVFMRSYSEEDTEAILYGDAFYSEGATTPLGQIRVSQGESVIHYDMKCQDYTGAYSEVVNGNANTNATLLPNKKVLISTKINFSKELLTNNRDNGNFNKMYASHIEMREASLPSELAKFHDISNFLKFDRNDYKEAFERFYSNQPLHCREEKPPFAATCKQFEYFIADLKKETELNLFPCDFVYQEQINGYPIQRTCMIIRMKTLATEYKVYFSKGYTMAGEPSIDYPYFEFVRQIPK